VRSPDGVAQEVVLPDHHNSKVVTAVVVLVIARVVGEEEAVEPSGHAEIAGVVAEADAEVDLARQKVAARPLPLHQHLRQVVATLESPIPSNKIREERSAPDSDCWYLVLSTFRRSPTKAYSIGESRDAFAEGDIMVRAACLECNNAIQAISLHGTQM